MLTWLKGFGFAKKYAVYCSDVSGAFDRVRVERLVAKLKAKGVSDRWLQLFASWLRERPARVVVGGKLSREVVLKDMVFQGTVWGPVFWNLFYGDAAQAVRDALFEELVFADDLNAYKEYDQAEDNKVLLRDAANCQAKLHR